MRKLNALLHDVTLIDFVFLARLTKRYKSISMFAVVMFLSVSSYLYFSQTTVHSKKVFFRMVSQDENPSSRKIDELVGDVAEGFVNQNEVKAMTSNFKFVHLLAGKIVNSQKFNELDFNNPKSNSMKSKDAVFKLCSDNDCRVKVLESIIPGLYEIESEIGTGRFILTVTTRSPVTTNEFINYFILAMKENRLNTILEDYDKKIAHTEELIDISRKDIENKGGFDKVATLESIEAIIDRQHDKMRDIIVRLNNEIHQNHYQEIRLKTAEVTAGKSIDGENRNDFEYYQSVSKNIAKLKQNIESIRSIPEPSRSPTDNAILAQLEMELKKNESELLTLGKIKRNVAHDQKFIDSQISNQTDYEFDYKITKQKLRKLQDESSKAKQELDELLSNKARLDNELLALKPDLEYLKMLESKMVNLRMLKSGARSNITFEDYGPEVSSFKRNTLAKILIFSFLIVGFFLFLTLVGIYLYDDRIYDEHEFAKCYEDLKIIGVAPTFE